MAETTSSAHVPIADNDRAEPTEGDDTSATDVPHPSTGAGSSSTQPSSTNNNDKLEMVGGCFEESGFRVKINGGNHVKIAGQHCVEMENGTTFHIELSNCNDFGCDVDISMTKLKQGGCQDVGGWRLDPRQERFAIHNSGYGQGKFVFYSTDPGKKNDDANQSNSINMESIFEIKFIPEAFSLYYKKRNAVDGRVKNVRVVKRSDATLKEVFKRLQKKGEITPATECAGVSFFDGRLILNDQELVQSVLGRQSKDRPFMLLKENEMISVDLDGRKKEIEIRPSRFDLELLKTKVQELYGNGEYLLKVEDEDITDNNWMKCLNADQVVQITKTVEPTELASNNSESTDDVTRGFRGVGLTRGLNLGDREGFGRFRGGGFRDVYDDEDDDDLQNSLLDSASGGYRGLDPPPGVGVVRFEGSAVQNFTTASNPGFVASYDDKVEMIIYLVSTSSSS